MTRSPQPPADPCRTRRCGRWITAAAWLAAGVLAATRVTAACPFCGVVEASLAERRDAADVVAIGDAAGPADADPAGRVVQPFAIRGLLRGATDADAASARVPAPITGTAVLFGRQDGAAMAWDAAAANETVLDHVFSAPAVEEPADRRLRWFLPRLDHPDPTIAADAFAEFGRAPFSAVRDVAAAFDVERLVAAVAAADDQRRRGFHGLALGLAAGATTDPATRGRCIAALHAAVEAPADDRRAGFDGILAGVLVAEGVEGRAFLRDRGLLAADTRPGDARHMLAALRFAWESLADTLPRDDVAAATAALIANPAVTADCVIDLARQKRWNDLERVAALWESAGRDDPLIRRAVAGYLTACPLPAARTCRERLASQHPDRWRTACAAAGVDHGR